MSVVWGVLVLAEKPKGIAFDLRESPQWAAVVFRYIDGSAMLKVYFVERKKYAVCLNFKRGKIPHWIIESLNEIKTSGIDCIGFEDGNTEEAGFKMGELVIQGEEPEPVMPPEVVVAMVSGDSAWSAEDIRAVAAESPMADFIRNSGVEEETFSPLPDSYFSVQELHLRRVIQLYLLGNHWQISSSGNATTAPRPFHS